MMSYLGRDQYLALAAATKNAVALAGGSTQVADMVGMRFRQNVERWYSIREGEEPRSIPLYAIADIESNIVDMGGFPPITAALARMYGYELSLVQHQTLILSPVCQLGHAMKEFGEAAERITDSYRDRKFTVDEKGDCLKEIDDAIREMERLRSVLRSAEVVDLTGRSA
ncbi:MAG: hypothetical protein JJ902_03890 [Roseibium sp.]|nr:hypothetical protein [Roseibium sp.]